MATFPGVGTAIGGVGGGIFGGLGGGELTSRGFDWVRSWFLITGLPHACLVESLDGSRRA
jgi:hypothetical protein